ncbi:MAG: methylated-DNA--[protein]-cysteine S-methyltransferase [Rikenellaceae bacterium]
MNTISATYPSPIGYICIEHHDAKLRRVQILGAELAACGQPDSFTDGVYSQILEYLAGERQHFDVEIDISPCTEFQQRVFRALQNIPYGTTHTYKEVAATIGQPTAARAVGMANNRNPIHIIIPCHRVVGSNGSMVGFAAGVAVKEKLLKLEQDLLLMTDSVGRG